jgi:hypothetical protein
MATWRCPHCATVQLETGRCFLCGRSATSCGTCALYRPSLVSGLGYCARDRRREPLSGAEQRGCWTAPGQAAAGILVIPTDAPPAPARGLIELG